MRRQPDQIVDADGRGPEQTDNAGTIGSRGLGNGKGDVIRSVLGFLKRLLKSLAKDRLQYINNVGGFGDERRALLEQPVGALRARIERRARHREHFASLFERHARGN